jgi:hypothetical protein
MQRHTLNFNFAAARPHDIAGAEHEHIETLNEHLPTMYAGVSDAREERIRRDIASLL